MSVNKVGYKVDNFQIAEFSFEVSEDELNKLSNNLANDHSEKVQIDNGIYILLKWEADRAIDNIVEEPQHGRQKALHIKKYIENHFKSFPNKERGLRV